MGMKQRMRRLVLLVLTLLLAMGLTLTGWAAGQRAIVSDGGVADAGGFAGDADWGGGGDSDWGGSFDWGDSDGYASDGVTSGELSPMFIIAIVVVIVVVVFASRRKGRKGASFGAGSSYRAAVRFDPASLERLQQLDPNFSQETMIEFIGNAYIRMQDAWESKHWEPMRALMTDALYSQYERQLDELKRNKQTNHVDKIAVLSVRLAGFTQTENDDVLRAELQTRIVDYVTDDATGALVRGSQSKELFMTYEWTLIRSKGTLTPDREAETHVNCPNCGAPLSIQHSAQCEYCGTVVTLSEHDWVLSAIRGISQRS